MRRPRQQLLKTKRFMLTVLSTSEVVDDATIGLTDIIHSLKAKTLEKVNSSHFFCGGCVVYYYSAMSSRRRYCYLSEDISETKIIFAKSGSYYTRSDGDHNFGTYSQM